MFHACVVCMCVQGSRPTPKNKSTSGSWSASRPRTRSSSAAATPRSSGTSSRIARRWGSRTGQTTGTSLTFPRPRFLYAPYFLLSLPHIASPGASLLTRFSSFSVARYLKRIFKDLFERQAFEDDGVYDWDLLKKQQEQGGSRGPTSTSLCFLSFCSAASWQCWCCTPARVLCLLRDRLYTHAIRRD